MAAQFGGTVKIGGNAVFHAGASAVPVPDNTFSLGSGSLRLGTGQQMVRLRVRHDQLFMMAYGDDGVAQIALTRRSPVVIAGCGQSWLEAASRRRDDVGTEFVAPCCSLVAAQTRNANSALCTTRAKGCPKTMRKL